ncbi:uncharacterized protein JN550_013778 [Neoarthrinium moseri]|uniref:uncharacterized protein n=1 Tax=Neoarthrinium moseri TaxID=1658444 RepID=UPI001FDDE4CE|nr:uncharacterized protein JN550_013778 [Neoarthrinium moseri]KAI1856495.1 hypothetical protein JN550_013778 [Neoarthrinium moseri]
MPNYCQKEKQCLEQRYTPVPEDGQWRMALHSAPENGRVRYCTLPRRRIYTSARIEEFTDGYAAVTEQKVKARRSGKSLLGKAKVLGKKANVFSMAMYWDPVHKKMRTVTLDRKDTHDLEALKAISENSQQISPAIHTDRGGSTQPALVSPVEAGQAASSSMYDFPGEEEDTIIVRDPPRRVDQASPISPQRTVSEVTIDEDALCQTLEVQAEQPEIDLQAVE